MTRQWWPDFIVSFSATLGGCARCRRLSLIAAVTAWIIVGVAIVSMPNVELAIGGCIIALALTGLWIAHVVRRGSQATLNSILRNLGATPEEAKAIVAALPKRAGQDAGTSTWLKEGETLQVKLAPRQTGKGNRPASVIVAGKHGIIAAVGLSDNDLYATLDPQELETDTVSEK
jgi:hypothetical protein